MGNTKSTYIINIQTIDVLAFFSYIITAHKKIGIIPAQIIIWVLSLKGKSFQIKLLIFFFSFIFCNFNIKIVFLKAKAIEMEEKYYLDLKKSLNSKEPIANNTRETI